MEKKSSVGNDFWKQLALYLLSQTKEAQAKREKGKASFQKDFEKTENRVFHHV